MRPAKSDHMLLTVGEGVVVLRRAGRQAITARVLGEQVSPDGAVRTLWLDRVIHEPREVTLAGVHVCGAVVTQLELPRERG